MKSILVVTDSFTVGGLETHIEGELRCLANNGVQVYLATGAAFRDLLLPRGLCREVVQLPVSLSLSCADVVRAVDRLRALISSNKIDCIHAHPFISPVVAKMAAELEGVRFATTLHGPASLHGFAPIHEWLLKNAVLRSCALTVVVSPELRDGAMSYGPKKSIVYLPNGVSFKSSHLKTIDGKELTDKWLVVSRLDDEKAIGVLDFVSKASAAGIRHIAIAGDGPATLKIADQLASEAADLSIEWLGERPDVTSLMKSAAGIAGMGRVVLEAVAAGKPAILVGYDGVKGVITRCFLGEAARTNFSGRGLTTIEAATLRDQLERLTAKSSDPRGVKKHALKLYNETEVWARFQTIFENIKPEKPGFLADLYYSLRHVAKGEKESFLYSSESHRRINDLCYRSKQFNIDHKLAMTSALALAGDIRVTQQYDQQIQVVGKLSELAAQSNRALTEVVQETSRQKTLIDSEVVQRGREAGELRQALAASEAAVREKESKASELRQALAASEAAVREKESEASELRQALAASEAAVREKESDSNEKTLTITKYEETIRIRIAEDAERQSFIDMLQKQKSEDKKAVEDLKSEVSILTKKLTDSEQKSNLQATELAQIQLKEAEISQRLEATLNQLASVTRSSSWRITLPLRAFARLARHGLIADDRAKIRGLVLKSYKRIGLPPTVHYAIKRNLAQLGLVERLRNVPHHHCQYNPYDYITFLKPIDFEHLDENPREDAPITPFSIVTTVYNEGSNITQFLESIQNQDIFPEELIIVDGGSSDNTAKQIERFQKRSELPIRLIKASRINIATGRNRGVSQAQGDIVVFLDAGCMLEQKFFRNLLAPMADSHVDAVCGAYEPFQPTTFSTQFVPDWQSEDLFRWFLPSARALCVRKRIFDEVGGFPEHLTLTGEDTLFGINYRHRSHRWILCRQARVRWKSPTCEKSAARLAFAYGRGDGESGYGDTQMYPHLAGYLKKGNLPADADPRLKGYIEGRLCRPEIEVSRRSIKGLFIILSGVPISDSGGGQRCAQLAMALIRSNYKVIFVNIYPSFEEPSQTYLPTDVSLLELYSLSDFSVSDLVTRYGKYDNLPVTIISEFPHPKLIDPINELRRAFGDRTTAIYDYIDNWQSSLGWEWYTPEVEQVFLDSSDLLVASAKTLVRNLEMRTAQTVALIPNAFNDKLFTAELPHGRPPDLPAKRPLIVYIGALWGDWFDWQLLEHAAEVLTDYDFILIGGANEERKLSLQNSYSNIHFLGLKPQVVLPGYLHYAAVCHIPFKVDHITKFVNPLKVYEYLAMGKPVVASDMPELRGLSGVLLADSPIEYIKLLRECVEGTYCFPATEVRNALGSHSWSARVEALEQLINNFRGKAFANE